jgi:hypothetical protein
LPVAHRVSTLLGAGTGSGAQGSSGGGEQDGQLQVASHRLMLQAGIMRQVPPHSPHNHIIYLFLFLFFN